MKKIYHLLVAILVLTSFEAFSQLTITSPVTVNDSQDNTLVIEGTIIGLTDQTTVTITISDGTNSIMTTAVAAASWSAIPVNLTTATPAAIVEGAGITIDAVTDGTVLVAPQVTFLYDITPPVFVSASAVGNTTIQLHYSETVDPTFNTGGDWLASGVTVTAATQNATFDSIVDLTVNGLNNTSFTAGDLALTINDDLLDSIGDVAGNRAANISGQTITDGQLPVLLSVTAIDNTTLALQYSETVTPTFNTAGDWAASGMTAVSAVQNATFDSIVDLTVSALNNTGFSPTDFALMINDDVSDRIIDAGGNLAADVNSVSVVDAQAPTVMITRQTPTSATTAASSVVFRATFSEAVSNVDATDFDVDNGTITGEVLDNVNPVSGLIYDITIDSYTGTGTIDLDFFGTQNIIDATTNAFDEITGITADSIFTVVAPDANSTITRVAGGEQTAPIDYTSFQGADGDPLTTVNTIQVLTFRVSDLGTADGFSTILDSLTVDITTGTASEIKAIGVFDGATLIGSEGNISASNVITLSTPISVSDGNNADFDVYVSFNDTVTDNSQFVFDISNAFEASAGTSSIGTFNATSTNNAGDNTITVGSIGLFVVAIDSFYAVNSNFNITVQAQDAGGSVDLDFTETMTISINTETAAGAPVLSGTTVIAAASGEVSFSTLQVDQVGDYTYEIVSPSYTSGSGNEAITVTTTAKNDLTDIIEDPTFSYPTNIDYTAYQGADIGGILGDNELLVAQFVVREGGEFGDDDNTVTRIDSDATGAGCGGDPVCPDGATGFKLVITGGEANIDQLALYTLDANTEVAAFVEVGEYDVASDNGTFVFNFDDDNGNFGDGNDFDVPDNGTAKLGIYVTFRNTITDNTQLTFEITEVWAQPGNIGGGVIPSGMANSNGAPVGEVANPATVPNADEDTGENFIEVDATALAIDTGDDPSGATYNRETGFSITVNAVDANGNVDLDETSVLSFTPAEGDVESPSSFQLTAGSLSVANVILDTANIAPFDMVIADANAGTGSDNGTTLSAATVTNLDIDDLVNPTIDNPLTTDLIPADDAAGASLTDDLTIVFSEPVVAGIGKVYIVRNTIPSIAEEINADDTDQVSINGDSVTISPSESLVGSSNYYVYIENNAFMDAAAGNNFAGYLNSTSWDFVTQADATPPQATIAIQALSSGSFSSTNDNTLTYDIVFNEDINASTFTGADVSVNSNSLTVDAPILTQVDSRSFRVVLNNISGNDDISIDIGPAIEDLSANNMSALVSSAVVTIDQTLPTATNVLISSNNVTKSNRAITGDTVTLTLDFDEGLNSDPIVSLKSGGATVNNPITLVETDVINDIWEVTYAVNALDVDGLVSFTVNYTDSAGNAGTPITAVAGTGALTSVTVDKAVPTVTISRDAVTLGSFASTTDNNVSYSIVFDNETMQDSISVADDIVTSSVGLAITTTTLSTTDSIDYTLTYSGITGNGDLSFTLNNGASSITDLAGNALVGPVVSEVITFDNLVPNITSITREDTDPTNATSITFRVLFNDAIDAATLTNADFVVANTAGGSPAVSAAIVEDVTGTEFLVSVTGVIGNGTLGLNFNGAVASGVSDAAGNNFTGSFTGEVYTIDNTVPTIPNVSISSNNVTKSNRAITGDTITLVLDFDDNLNAAPVVAIKSGGATVNNPITLVETDAINDIWEATYAVNALDVDGLVTFTVDFSDSTGNAGVTVTAVAGTGAMTSVTVDKTVPAVTITRDAVGLGSFAGTTDNIVSYSIVFDNETMQDSISVADDIVTSSVGLAITTTTLSTTDSIDYTLTYSGITGNGDLSFTLNNGASSITDLAGNALVGPVASEVITFDNVVPNITSITREDTDPTNAASVTFRVLFNDAIDVATLTNADFVVANTAGGSPAVSAAIVEDVTGTEFLVSVTGVTGNGTLGLNFNGAVASGVSDAAGNNFTGSFTGEVYTIDNTVPTIPNVSISSDNATSASHAQVGDIVTLTLDFDEDLNSDPVISMRSGGANITNAITVTETNAVLDIWEASYTVDALDAEGAVTFTVDFADSTGNVGSTVTMVTGTGTGSSVTVDKSAPMIDVVSITSDNANSRLAVVGSTVTLTMDFSENLGTAPTVVFESGAVAIATPLSVVYNELDAAQEIWTATYIVDGSDTEGDITFTIDFADTAGISGSQVNAVTNGTNVVFDLTSPVLSNENSNVVDSLVTVEVQSTELGTAYVLLQDTSVLDVTDSSVVAASINSFAIDNTLGAISTTISANPNSVLEAFIVVADTFGNISSISKVTPIITGGVIITAPSLVNICNTPLSQRVLGDIVITERVVTDIKQMGAGSQSILLELPTGFYFDTSVSPVFTTSAGSDITGLSTVFDNADILRLTFNVTGISNLDTLTIANLEIGGEGSTEFSASAIRRTDGSANIYKGAVSDNNIFASLSSVNNPTVPILTLNDGDYCSGLDPDAEGLTISVAATGTLGWFEDDGDSLAAIGASNTPSFNDLFSTSNPAVGVYTAHAVQQSASGCISDSLDVVIRIDELPDAQTIAGNDIGAGANVCSNEEITLGNPLNAALSGFSYLWTGDGIVNGTDSVTTFNVPVNPRIDGTSDTTVTYNLRVTNNSTSCFDDDDVTVVISERVNVGEIISESGTSLLIDDEDIELKASQPVGFSGSYVGSGFGVPFTEAGTPDTLLVNFSPSLVNEGTFNIDYILSENATGCSDTTSLEIIVQNESNFFSNLTASNGDLEFCKADDTDYVLVVDTLTDAPASFGDPRFFGLAVSPFSSYVVQVNPSGDPSLYRFNPDDIPIGLFESRLSPGAEFVEITMRRVYYDASVGPISIGNRETAGITKFRIYKSPDLEISSIIDNSISPQSFCEGQDDLLLQAKLTRGDTSAVIGFSTYNVTRGVNGVFGAGTDFVNSVLDFEDIYSQVGSGGVDTMRLRVQSSVGDDSFYEVSNNRDGCTNTDSVLFIINGKPNVPALDSIGDVAIGNQSEFTFCGTEDIDRFKFSANFATDAIGIKETNDDNYNFDGRGLTRQITENALGLSDDKGDLEVGNPIITNEYQFIIRDNNACLSDSVSFTVNLINTFDDTPEFANVAEAKEDANTGDVLLEYCQGDFFNNLILETTSVQDTSTLPGTMALGTTSRFNWYPENLANLGNPNVLSPLGLGTLGNFRLPSTPIDSIKNTPGTYKFWISQTDFIKTPVATDSIKFIGCETDYTFLTIEIKEIPDAPIVVEEYYACDSAIQVFQTGSSVSRDNIASPGTSNTLFTWFRDVAKSDTILSSSTVTNLSLGLIYPGGIVISGDTNVYLSQTRDINIATEFEGCESDTTGIVISTFDVQNSPIINSDETNFTNSQDVLFNYCFGELDADVKYTGTRDNEAATDFEFNWFILEGDSSFFSEVPDVSLSNTTRTVAAPSLLLAGISDTSRLFKLTVNTDVVAGAFEGCESQPTYMTVNIFDIPSAPVADDQFYYCEDDQFENIVLKGENGAAFYRYGTLDDAETGTGGNLLTSAMDSTILTATVIGLAVDSLDATVGGGNDYFFTQVTNFNEVGDGNFNGCISSVFELNVEVFATPEKTDLITTGDLTLSSGGNRTEFCFDDVITGKLTIDNPGTGAAFYWFDQQVSNPIEDVSSTIDQSTSNSPDFNIDFNIIPSGDSVIYVYRVENTGISVDFDGCFSSVDSITISKIVNPNSPTLFTGVNRLAICQNDELTSLDAFLIDNISTNLYNYNWYNTAGTALFLDKDTVTVGDYLNAIGFGTESVRDLQLNVSRVSNSGAGCESAETTVDLRINRQPNPSFVLASFPDNICSNAMPASINTAEDLGLVGVFSGLGITDLTNGEALFDPQMAVSDFTEDSTVVVQYSVTQNHGTDPSCISQIERNIEVLKINDLSISINSDVNNPSFDISDFCNTDENGNPVSINLEGNSPETPITQVFSLVGAGLNGLSTTGANTAAINLKTLFESTGAADNARVNIEYSVSDDRGCLHAVEDSILIYQIPNVILGAVSGGCQDDPIDLSVLIDGNSSGNYSIIWDFGDGSENDSTNAFSLTHPYLESRDFDLVVNVEDNAKKCKNKLIRSIPIGSSPTAQFAWKNITEDNVTKIFFRDPTQTDELFGLASDNIKSIEVFVEGSSIIERDGLTPEALSDTVFHTFNDAGNFEVKLLTESNNGCVDSVMRQVYILPRLTVAPNGYLEDFEVTDVFSWILDETYIEDVDANTVIDSVFSLSPRVASWNLGVPLDTLIAGGGANGNAWITSEADGTYANNQNSWIMSPSFDISGLDRPMIKFNTAWNFAFGNDGVALQYSLDDGSTWNLLGDYIAADREGTGINWYNAANIDGSPANKSVMQVNRDKGWTDLSRGDEDEGPLGPKDWLSARHRLDEIPVDQRANLRFRLALGTDGGSDAAGFAFDDFWIGNRTLKVLVEEFSSSVDGISETAVFKIRERLDNPELNNNDVTYIDYHTELAGKGDPINEINTIDPNVRTLFYGIDFVPTSLINGAVNEDVGNQSVTNAIDYELPWIENALKTSALNDPAFTIDINAGGAIGTTLNINVNIDLTDEGRSEFNIDFQNQNLKAYIVIVDPEVIQGGTTLAYTNVVRKLLPGAEGSDVDTENTVLTETWKITKMSRPDSIVVVAFVQDVDSKVIYQSASVVVQGKQAIVTGSTIPAYEQQDFVLYPNPADNLVTAGFNSVLRSDKQWRMLDINGQVFKAGIVRKGVNRLEISTSNVPLGVYFLQMIAEDGEMIVKKLAITH